ncbi:MAG: peptidyl-prolyl cis-trans isomerase [Candidatus Krumholzibacteriota bacterium]|nr:peptidyl-prolyl cis-trans isomerase [Candidatus Krumholzibacteriota bacterium]
MTGKKILLAVFLMIPGLILVSCGEKDKPLQINEGVAARIGDRKLTESEIDEIFETLPENQKDDFKGPRGRAKFVDMVINDELLFLAAKNMNLANDPETKKQIEVVTRKVLVSAYYKKQIFDKIEISDEEIESYYKDHEERYTNKAIIKAQHIFSVDSMKCVAWKKRIENGEKFSAIAKAESEDKSSAEAYGSLGYFNTDGYVKFIGDSKEFNDAIKDLETGEMSDVIKHRKGYSLVRINDKKPESLKPLSEVRKSIIDIIKQEKAKASMEVEIESLRDKFKPVNYAQEVVIATTRTPEQLWEIAQAEDAAYTRVLYYRELVNKYPEHKYAAQALFMIGFVYGEELKDLTQAQRTYNELLEKYPDSEVAKSAEWMLENLHKEHPKFESIENVHEEMKKESE